MNMTWTHLKPLYPQKEHVLQVRRPKHILEKIHNGGYAREELIYEGFCKCRWDTSGESVEPGKGHHHPFLRGLHNHRNVIGLHQCAIMSKMNALRVEEIEFGLSGEKSRE